MSNAAKNSNEKGPGRSPLDVATRMPLTLARTVTMQWRGVESQTE